MDKNMDFKSLGPQFLQKFDPNDMEFLLWQNSFEHLVHFLNVPDGVKSYFLLDMLGSSAYEMVQEKLGQIDLSNLPYDTFKSKLVEIFSYYHDELAARKSFNQRNQFLDESVREYSKVLSKIIVKCNYGLKSSCNLLNRFINGIRNERAQFTIRKMEISSFREAVQMAERIESLEDNN